MNPTTAIAAVLLVASLLITFWMWAIRSGQAWAPEIPRAWAIPGISMLFSLTFVHWLSCLAPSSFYSWAED